MASDQNFTLKYVSIANLIPDTKHYVTYEGSMTTPACSETVTWVLVNRPLLISSTDVRENSFFKHWYY